MEDTKKDIESIRWEFLKRSETYKRYCELESKLNKSAKIVSNMPSPIHLHLLYLQYGDIREKTYSDYLRRNEAIASNTNVSICVLKIKKTILEDYVIDFTRPPCGLKKGPPTQLCSNDIYFLVRQKNFTYEEANELAKAMGKILKERIPKKRFSRDIMNRYLKVYDQRKKQVSYKTICKEAYPKLSYTDSRERHLKADYRRAKEIIKNIENGLLFYW